MSTIDGKWDDDDEYSVIGDKGEIGFIDYEKEPSVCNYIPEEEGPITISAPFPFVDGKPQSVPVGETACDSITIKNTTDEAVDLWTKIFASNPENCFTLSLMKPASANDLDSGRGFLESFKLEDRMVQPGETLTIWLSCKPAEIGLCTSVVHFDVGTDRIECVAFLLAEDKVSQSLASRKPFSRGAKKKQFRTDEFVVGQRPIGNRDRVSKNRLPRYPIPKDIRELIESKQIPNTVLAGLTRENYASYFKTLLIMEEIQLEQDMRAYDMENITMTKKGIFLTLVVPGLTERRPSLVHGDHIFVKSAGAEDNTAPYQGFIHRVEADEVYLRFAPEFHNFQIDGNLYDVNFTYSRLSVKRQYQAIDAARNLQAEFLFPSESSVQRFIKDIPLVPISCSLNDQQILAIEKILGCKGGPPYVVHGPPGTGKTKTIVEAILQLYQNQNNTCILACAPSNSAADHILENLLSETAVNIRENEIFRLNAASRSLDDVKPDFIHFCFFDALIFKCPPLRALSRYRIIISTYMSASLLHAEGVQPGHFSHIILDEAGQASEPETMVPIANLYHRETVVVLAGDPMQLGPVIQSRDSQKYGLGKSFMERLFECEPYCLGDENYITKLVRNYRCHPEILHLPSNLFYEGDLIACKESNDDTNSLLSLVNLLPGKNFPVLFFGIQGCDEREGNNPSWFNRIEASKVVEVIKKLTGRGCVDNADIGVITPYRQQVLKLKKALEDLDMLDVKVGSVEQFQGQERRVIIVSTVRSTVKHNEFDRVHCLGFLSNPRRFNVAITRAISLLVIVGNPHIISMDPFWNKLLWYCEDHGSYQGCTLPDRVECINEYQMQEEWIDENQMQEERIDQNQIRQDCHENGAYNLEPSEEVEWGQESFQNETSKPAAEEDEWSDGWK